MAIHLHRTGVTLLGQKISCLSSSPAVSPLLGRTKATFSVPLEHSSRLLVRCAAASKGIEVQSAKTPVLKYDEKELPPLVATMAITGLPPCNESKYADEALAAIMKTWPSNWAELESYARVCNSCMSFMHAGVVSAERLIGPSTSCTLLTMLDDNVIDLQKSSVLENIGVDPSILASPDSIREFYHTLDALFRQEEAPHNPTQIEEKIWQLGSYYRKLSNPEWFNLYANAILELYDSNLESYIANLAGDKTNITDLEAYTRMRQRNTAGRICTLNVEFANNLFLPKEIREHPVVQQLTSHAMTYNAFINDVFSFCKEVDEDHAPNLIKVLMEGEGKSLPEAAWKAVHLTNSFAQGAMELEGQLPAWEKEPWAIAVQRYTLGLKEGMSGMLYWYSMQKRYRHPEAAFPELRDDDHGASFFPRASEFTGL